MGWLYRKAHAINGTTAGAQTNYQMRIVVYYGSGTDSGESVYLNGKCRTDFGDIRFTASDGVTPLDYWMESYTVSSNAVFWVEVPSIPASPNTTTIYIYYGNSNATTTSNGVNTFVAFDDFSTDTLSQYVLIDNVWTISNGILSRNATSVVGGFISKSMSLSRAYALRAYFYAGSSDCGPGFIWGTAGGGESSVSGYIANYYYNNSSYSYVRRYSAGSFTNLVALPTTYSGWATLEIRIDPTYITVIRNNVQDAQVSDTTFSTLSGIGFRQKATSVSAVDWWALRKYVSPEPSHGAWGSEEEAFFMSEATRISDSRRLDIAKYLYE